MLVIPHRFKEISLHNFVVRRIFSDVLLVLGLKKVEKHWRRGNKDKVRNETEGHQNKKKKKKNYYLLQFSVQLVSVHL
jgi:hypothetical protein